MKLLLVCELLQLKKKREWVHQVLQQRETEGKKFCRLHNPANSLIVNSSSLYFKGNAQT